MKSRRVTRDFSQRIEDMSNREEIRELVKESEQAIRRILEHQDEFAPESYHSSRRRVDGSDRSTNS